MAIASSCGVKREKVRHVRDARPKTSAMLGLHGNKDGVMRVTQPAVVQGTVTFCFWWNFILVASFIIVALGGPWSHSSGREHPHISLAFDSPPKGNGQQKRSILSDVFRVRFTFVQSSYHTINIDC